MAKVVAIGCSGIYIGDVAADGGMGTSLTKYSSEVIDTPVFTIPEGDTTDFEIEDSDDPYYSKTKAGVKTFAASFYGLNATILAALYGGTAVVTPGSTGTDTWDAPSTIPQKEVSLIAVHEQGGHLKIVRGLMTTTLDWAFQKNNLPKMNISVKVLSPTKANTAPFSFSTDNYPPA